MKANICSNNLGDNEMMAMFDEAESSPEKKQKLDEYTNKFVQYGEF